MSEPIFFCSEEGQYGFFSNWYPCKFRITYTFTFSLSEEFDGFFCRRADHKREFSSLEQWMMYCKAAMFPGNEEIVEKIFTVKGSDNHDTQKQIKELGRQVKNFDQKVWDNSKEDVVTVGLYFKFSQNEDLLKKLRATKGRPLFEAASYDKIWGIGLKEEQALEYLKDGKPFPGQNLLGKCLERVRNQL